MLSVEKEWTVICYSELKASGGFTGNVPDKITCIELRERLGGPQDTVAVLQCNSLRWYGQMLQKDVSEWVKKQWILWLKMPGPELDHRENGRN